jgi:hypothetical protein
MKVNQLLNVIESTKRLYRERGDASAAGSLNHFSDFCAEYQTMTVANFAKLIAKAAEPQDDS